MDAKAHWETVYQTKAPTSVSWYSPHLERSMEIIGKLGLEPSAQIIDVGAGESTLVDDLIADGYLNLTVLDISQTALDVARQRLGEKASSVAWKQADITAVELPLQKFDLWHDRAVFHFLTNVEQRLAYVRGVMRSVKPGGYVIVATFGPQGPEKCSGLNVMRYDADSLHHEFGKTFKLLDSLTEQHQTPFGTTQQFVYCYCKVEVSADC